MHVCKICVKMVSESDFTASKFQNFPGGACPQTPPRMACFTHWDALRALLSSLKLCTGLPDQCQIASDSPEVGSLKCMDIKINLLFTLQYKQGSINNGHNFNLHI